MSGFKSPPGATILPDLFDRGQSTAIIKLVDTSGGAAGNEREIKLGNFCSQIAAAVGVFDPNSNTFGLIDGFHGAPVTSLMPFEPDNWNPRLHTEGGRGRDNVWATRLITDHSNPAAGRGNRSTHWIDQEMAQEWAGSDDLFRIVEKDTPVDDPELHYTMAGFLALFSGAQDPKGRPGIQVASQGGKGSRGALAVDICRNLGYTADQKNFAQFSHALVFLKVEPARPDVETPGDHDPNRPDVPTVDDRQHVPPADVPTVDPRFADPTGSGAPTVSSNPNGRGWGGGGGTVSSNPSNRGPEANPAAATGSQGQNLSVHGGQLYLNGSPVSSLASPADPGPDEEEPEQVGNRARTENELGLRLDVGFLCDKAGKVARFKDDQPPSAADEGDGDIKLCTIFVLDSDAPPDDGLDTLEDENSNHVKLPKPVKKKKFAAWVRVPKPGDSECHHYDYSWHSPPPESSSSSGSSSGSDVATPGGGGGSGRGTTTPDGPTTGPTGPRPVPTVDDAYQNPDGSPIPDDEPSTRSGAPSSQVQHGFAPPRSPGYSIRGNILPKITGANPVGSFVATKANRYRNVIVQLVVAFSDDIAAGELIELNVIIGAHAGGSGPATFYRQAFVFDGDNDWVADPKEYELKLFFQGFDPAEQIFTVLIERRNDTTLGTNSAAELCIIRSSFLSN